MRLTVVGLVQLVCGQDPDNVSRCQLMPFNEAGWQFVQISLYRWWRQWQIWRGA